MKTQAKTLTLLLLLAWMATLTTASGSTLSAGNKSTLYINGSGDLFAWGANNVGQLGDGTEIDRRDPVIPVESGPWSDISVSLLPVDATPASVHSLAVKADGTLWAWGDNSRGQLGLGDTLNRSEPTRVGPSNTWKSVAAGSGFSMALNQAGEIWVWGNNNFKQLGAGVSENFRTVPVKLADKDGDSNADTFIAIAAGASHALAIHGNSAADSFGQIYAWGRNTEGQLGLGHANPVAGPVLVPTPNSFQFWKVVEAGVHSSFAIDTSSKLYAWGSGPFGSLGIGDNQGTSIQQSSSPTLTKNSTLSSMVYESVSAGIDHTLAVASGGGSIYGAGIKFRLGALGTGGSDRYSSFTHLNFQPPAGATIAAAGAGADYSVIALDNGLVFSTGGNDRGQLGNGSTSSQSSFGGTSLGAVDLTVDSINLVSDPGMLEPGNMVTFDIIVRNQATGTVAAGTGGNIRVALSPQAVFGAEGQLDFADTVAVPLADAIAPGGAVSVRVSAKLPDEVPTGDYRILVDLDVDNELEESDENNNFAATAAPDGLLQFRADLQIELIESSLPASIEAGQSFEVDVAFSNTGTGSLTGGAGNAFEYRLILSDSDDPFIGSVFSLVIDEAMSEFPFLSPLPAGAPAEIRTVTVTVPEDVALGGFFVGAIVDSAEQILELDETNNTYFTGTASLTVTGLSLRQALDLPEPPADDPATPDIDESVPTDLTIGGDGNWFGKVDASAVGGDALNSPKLEAGEFAALTFQFDSPREVTFRWKSATSSSQNRLFFGANRVPLQSENIAEPVVLFGNRDWSEVNFIVPANTPVGFFYEQGVPAENDRVFVDNLRVSQPIDKPDYVIDDIQFEAGEFMLRRDRLTVTVTGINRGADFDLPEDFIVSVWLSRDRKAGNADDVLLGDLSAFQILDNGTKFVYRASFDLPDELADADYYVLARVDSTNVVEEFNEAPPFSNTDNNFAFSEDPGVRIIRAADLRVTRLVGSGELPIFVGGPADHPGFDPAAGQGEPTVFGTFYIEPLPGEKSELQVRFDVINEGLAPIVAQDYTIRIFMTTDRAADASEGITLFEFVEGGGLAVGSGKAFEITTSIPETISPGQFYIVGVQVDALDEVMESNESNNVTRSEERNIFVGEVPLEIALNDLLSNPAARAWNDGFPGSTEGSESDSPWFGQSATVQLDSVIPAAARSGPVPIGGSSEMTTILEVADNPQLISFFWKVSSQLDAATGQRDFLIFDIRQGSSGPFQTIAGPIAGEVDWTKVEHTIADSGTYTLRWRYIESGDGVRGGADAGWVDNFSAAAPDFVPMNPDSRTVAGDPSSSVTPGLKVTATELVGDTSDGVLVPGDNVTIEFDVQNLGDGFFESVRTQVRLARTTGTAANLDWTSAGASDVLLLANERIDVADGSGAGGFNRTFTIPDSLAEAGDFFVGVWVDFANSIPESSEANNLQFSSTPLTLAPLFTLDEALDTDVVPWTDDGREWKLAGQSGWFAVGEDPGTADQETFDGADAMRSPADLKLGQSAILERVIEGPVLLEFHWKSDTTPEENFLEFRINGVSQTREFGPEAGEALRISGAVDWRSETVLIPAGQQVVSFVYEKNSDANPEDAVRVDKVSQSPVTAPDLAIVPSNVSFNPSPDPDTGVQSFALERDAFPLSVTVVNRGATPSGFNYNDLDIEVRFSNNREIGPDDHIVGNLAVSEILESGQRLIFSGSIDLPLDLAAQKYFLLLQVKSLDPGFTEFEALGTELLSNNFFASQDQSIEIIHLPRLDTDLDGSGVVTEKVYYPKESIRLDWKLLNIGLGDIGGDGSSGYDQTIQLWTFPPGTTEFTIANGEYVRDMHVENERAFLPGALNRESLADATVRYQTELTIPRAGELLNEIGEIDQELEDEDASVVLALDTLWEYTFYFVIVRENGPEFPQSSNLAVKHFTSERFKIAAFPVDDVATDSFTGGTFVNYETWRRFNEDLLTASTDLEMTRPALSPNPMDSTFGNNVEDLFYYALNLPLSANTRLDTAPAMLNRFGTTIVDGDKFQRITFPIVRGAQDLHYIVEASDDLVTWEEILTIEPPYLDERSGVQAGYIGAQSLTGPEASALINQPSPNGGGYLPITAIINQNYTATVTVRDYKPLGSVSSRFMRLRIEFTGP